MSRIAQTSLVIDARKLERMCMDGPALKVIMQQSSPILFPLRRLSRIHIIGTPSSGMDALLHCAEQCIPIAFFHANGRLRCRLQPAANCQSSLKHWFEHVEFDPEAQAIYTEWQLNQVLHMLAILGFNAGARDNRHKLVNEALRGACKEMMGKENFKSALDWIDGLLQFHLEQIIEHAGVTQSSIGKNKLIGDIKPICELPLLQNLAGQARGERNFYVSAQSMTSFYQRQAEHIEYTVKRMLSQLATRLEAII